jgi:metallo-beta-lactamase family protein
VHADHPELIDWLRSATRPADAVHLVHGEPEGAEALRADIAAELGWPVSVATHLAQVSIA